MRRSQMDRLAGRLGEYHSSAFSTTMNRCWFIVNGRSGKCFCCCWWWWRWWACDACTYSIHFVRRLASQRQLFTIEHQAGRATESRCLQDGFRSLQQVRLWRNNKRNREKASSWQSTLFLINPFRTVWNIWRTFGMGFSSDDPIVGVWSRTWSQSCWTWANLVASFSFHVFNSASNWTCFSDNCCTWIAMVARMLLRNFLQRTWFDKFN